MSTCRVYSSAFSITCMHLFCCLQFLILLFSEQPLCWLPKPSSTVAEGEAVPLVLLFWRAQHSFSWHSLQRVVAEISAQTPLHVQSLQSSPAFCGPGLYTVVGKWLNSLAYCIVAILQFNSLLIPVLSPHFLSNELRLLLKISPSFSFMAVLTISHLIYEGSSVAKSCRIFLLPWFWPITPLLYKTVLIYKSEHNSVDRTSQQPLITLMINVMSVISLANFSMLY